MHKLKIVDEEKVIKYMKLILVSYIHHVRDEVKNENRDYIELGIDNSIQIYIDIFEDVIRCMLFNEKTILPENVYKNISNYITKSIEEGDKEFIENHRNEIYRKCIRIMDMLVKGAYPNKFNN